MEHGNLSSQVVPRILVVYEGLVGYLRPDRVEEYNRLGSRGDWPGAVDLWDMSPLALAKLNDVIIRRDIKVEIVTFVMPREGAEALAARFDEENVLVSRVLASTPERTARGLAYGIDIARVYASDPRHALMCGAKGFHAVSAHDIGR